MKINLKPRTCIADISDLDPSMNGSIFHHLCCKAFKYSSAMLSVYQSHNSWRRFNTDLLRLIQRASNSAISNVSFTHSKLFTSKWAIFSQSQSVTCTLNLFSILCSYSKKQSLTILYVFSMSTIIIMYDIILLTDKLIHRVNNIKSSLSGIFNDYFSYTNHNL